MASSRDNKKTAGVYFVVSSCSTAEDSFSSTFFLAVVASLFNLSKGLSPNIFSRLSLKMTSLSKSTLASSVNLSLCSIKR
jgi:hypothetical protein